MTTEVFAMTNETDTLPDHIAIGLADETNQNIDAYVADVQERLEEATPIADIEAEVLELVSEALPYEPSEADLVQIE